MEVSISMLIVQYGERDFTTFDNFSHPKKSSKADKSWCTDVKSCETPPSYSIS